MPTDSVTLEPAVLQSVTLSPVSLEEPAALGAVTFEAPRQPAAVPATPRATASPSPAVAITSPVRSELREQADTVLRELEDLSVQAVGDIAALREAAEFEARRIEDRAHADVASLLAEARQSLAEARAQAPSIIERARSSASGTIEAAAADASRYHRRAADTMADARAVADAQLADAHRRAELAGLAHDAHLAEQRAPFERRIAELEADIHALETRRENAVAAIGSVIQALRVAGTDMSTQAPPAARPAPAPAAPRLTAVRSADTLAA